MTTSPATRWRALVCVLRLPVGHQHGRQPADDAGERHDAALHLLWRLVAHRHRHFHGHGAGADAQPPSRLQRKTAAVRARGAATCRSAVAGMPKGTILLAAGGTGGHLFPAEALAHEMVARGWKVHLATDDRAERYRRTFPGDRGASDRVGHLRLEEPARAGRSFWTIWRSVRQASRSSAASSRRSWSASAAGPTIPPLYAANAPQACLLSLHEQNAVMGRANKALGREGRCDRRRLPAPQSSGQSQRQDRRHRQPGAPGGAGRPPPTPYQPSRGGEPFRLLVFGGSQGAQFFSDAVPAAIALLPQEQPHASRWCTAAGARRRCRPRQGGLCRTRHGAGGIALLHRHGRAHRCRPSRHLALGRLDRLGDFGHRPPGLPRALSLRARPRPGGERCCTRRSRRRRAASAVDTLHGTARQPRSAMAISQPERLESMASAAKSAGKPDAARLLADLAEAIASGKSVEEFRKGERP